MKKVVFFYLLLLSVSTWAEEGLKTPSMQMSLIFNETRNNIINTTVFKNETLYIPMTLTYNFLTVPRIWKLPPHIPGLGFQNKGPQCPGLANDNNPIKSSGICYMDFIVTTGNLPVGTNITSYFLYDVIHENHLHSKAMYFGVIIVPHHLSMSNIPPQNAIIKKDFIYPIKNAVYYYAENIEAGAAGIVQLKMSPEDKTRLNDLDLYFDPKDFSIKGKPNKVGSFTFNIATRNAYSEAVAKPLTINVSYNKEDKPRFKQNNSLANATFTKEYHLNLLHLLEQSSFSPNNQVTFKVIKSSSNAEWLQINPNNPYALTGTPQDKHLAGQTAEITLVAISNTGGESDELTLRIPIAPDSEQQPIIEKFEITQDAGTKFYVNVLPYISSSVKESEPKIIIDEVAPQSLQLEVSSTNSSQLEGFVPSEFVGQTYLITLRASTIVGGSSEPVIIPLYINTNPNLKPQFKGGKPQLPIAYPGQAFEYDFVANRDVYPEYEDISYEVQFAEGYQPPYWLRLENNKLVASEIFDMDDDINIRLVIKNTPGGISETVTIPLKIMN